MRIISGKYKGRKLATFEGDAIRPTSDRAKEGVFSVLQFELVNKRFYDGFCGSGAMGIEALYIDKDTTIRNFKKDIMLGEVFYR